MLILLQTYIGFVTLTGLSIPAFEVGLSLQFLLHHGIGVHSLS